jgi:hypothetical protein
MANTVAVMTSRANWKMVYYVVDMVSVNAGNASVMQTGLVRPAIVYFLQRTVKLMKATHSALIMAIASVVLVTVMKNIQENTVKI